MFPDRLSGRRMTFRRFGADAKSTASWRFGERAVSTSRDAGANESF
jgi:hypothetical protein